MNHNKNRSMIFYAAVNMAAAALTVFTDITFRVCKQFTFTAMPLYVLSIAVPIAEMCIRDRINRPGPDR